MDFTIEKKNLKEKTVSPVIMNKENLVSLSFQPYHPFKAPFPNQGSSSL